MIVEAFALHAAMGALIAAALTALHYVWFARARNAAIAEAGAALTVAVLGVFFAVVGAGWQPRRSAIAFMMAPWGARRAIVVLYTRVFGKPADDAIRSAWWFAAHGAAAFICAMPALVASANPTEGFAIEELVASGVWLAAFAAEAADRPRLRAARWVSCAAFALFGYASL